jgi:hypothetical protein
MENWDLEVKVIGNDMEVTVTGEIINSETCASGYDFEGDDV